MEHFMTIPAPATTPALPARSRGNASAKAGETAEPLELSLAEAIAIRDRYGKIGNKNHLTRNILYEANRIIDQSAEAAFERVSKGICTDCWGDGFNRIGPGLLGGPCGKCKGTGRIPAPHDDPEN